MNISITRQQHQDKIAYVAKRDGMKLGVFETLDEALERTALEQAETPRFRSRVNIWQSKRYL